jgi:hypothetical protein
MNLETRVWWRFMRCVVAQGIGRALMWIVLLSAAGAAGYLAATKCPQGMTCVDVQKMKGKQ